MKKSLLSIVGLMFSIVAFAVDGNLRKLGGWEHRYTSYTYAGLPIKSVHVHTANGKRTIQENYSYDYDHAARLVKTTYGINGSPEKVLSSLDYDDLGRVFTQTLLGKESVAYLYNIRNWKTDIIGQNFNQLLAYNHNNGTSTFAELLSKSDKFENVLIIGPNKNVRVYYSKLRKIGNLKDGNSLYLARYNSTAVQTLNPRTKRLEQGGG